MIDKLKPKKRPKVLVGTTHRVETGCGHLYITINRDKDELFEVFAALGKNLDSVEQPKLRQFVAVSQQH